MGDDLIGVFLRFLLPVGKLTLNYLKSLTLNFLVFIVIVGNTEHRRLATSGKRPTGYDCYARGQVGMLLIN